MVAVVRHFDLLMLRLLLCFALSSNSWSQSSCLRGMTNVMEARTKRHIIDCASSVNTFIAHQFILPSKCGAHLGLLTLTARTRSAGGLVFCIAIHYLISNRQSPAFKNLKLGAGFAFIALCFQGFPRITYSLGSTVAKQPSTLFAV